MLKSTGKHHDNSDCCYFLFASLLLWSCCSACPEACNCISNKKWKCANITLLGDILAWKGNSTRTVQELTLIHLTDLNNFSDHLGASSHVASFETVSRLKIQQSTISKVSALFIDSFPNVEKVFLEDNQFSCNEHILGLQKWESKIRNKLQCSSPDGMAGSDLFRALKIISRVKEECPKACRCIVKTLNSQYSIPNLFVNCSQSNLKLIPDSLPKSWVIELDLSYNQIEDAAPLFSLPLYQNVSVLNLAHNLIQDIQVPNDTSHKNQFRLLNLSYNKLTRLPKNVIVDSYTFSYQPVIMLRSNPWACDCNSIKMFQNIAMKQLHIIGDFFYLTCGTDLEEELISSPTSLQRVCYVPAAAIMTIRCINIFCFILVGLGLIKTAFDLRSMYAVGIFHYFTHLLLLPSQ